MSGDTPARLPSMLADRLDTVRKGLRGYRHELAVGVFFAAVLVRLGYWRVSGTVVNKSSEHFVAFCDAAGAGENVFLAVLQSPQGAYRFLFTGYWLPMCVPYLAGGGSPDAVVGWQILVSGLTTVLVFDLGRRYADELAGLVAALFMVGMLDNFAWTTRLLSDTVFAFVVVLALWQFVRYREDPTRRRRALLWAVLGWVAVTKPQGAVVVLGWLAFDLTPDRFGVRYDLVPRKLGAAAAAIVAVPMIAFAVPHALDQAVSQWRQGLLVQFDETLQYEFVPRAANGSIEFFLVNADHMMIMALLKGLLFYLPVYGRFSTLHNAANAVTLLPVIAFGFAGLAKLVRDRPRVARDLGVPVATLTLVVMATFIDYSWGYRVPVVPPLAVAAGYALTRNRWCRPT